MNPMANITTHLTAEMEEQLADIQNLFKCGKDIVSKAMKIGAVKVPRNRRQGWRKSSTLREKEYQEHLKTTYADRIFSKLNNQ
jgi:hypothetical protein